MRGQIFENLPYQWAIPENIQTGGVEDMEFLEVLKKKHV